MTTGRSSITGQPARCVTEGAFPTVRAIFKGPRYVRENSRLPEVRETV